MKIKTKNLKSKIGIIVLVSLQTFLIILKSLNRLTWGWWSIFSPLWIVAIMVFIVALVIYYKK